MSKTRVTWLHISDLHHGQPGEGGRWPHYREPILADMEKQAQRLGPPDLILFTGDLAFSGKHDEYEKVTETLAQIRQAVGGDPVVVPVPGNHDLQRPSKSYAAAKMFASYHDDDDLRKSVISPKDRDKGNVAFLAGLFEDFERWWEAEVIADWRRRGYDFQRGLLPGDFLLSVPVNGLRLGIVGLNSAFLHYGDNGEGRLAVEVEQLPDEVSSWIADHHAALLLMHHPTDWLDRKRERDFESLIYPSNRFVACLFGHMHESQGKTEIIASKQRVFVQSASLCGLEYYGTSREERAVGYSWGRLECDSETRGKLRLWPREAYRSPGGDIEVGAQRGAKSKPIKVAIRKPVDRRRPRPASMSRDAWRELALGHFDDEFRQAKDEFRAGRLTSALSKARAILEQLEQKAEPGAEDEHLERARSRCHLFIAICLVNLQDRDAAREQIAIVRESLLAEHSRITLAQVLVALGENERADALIQGIDGDDADVTRQLLMIAGGQVPEQLVDDPIVRLWAGKLWLDSGQHDRIGREAMAILENHRDDPRLVMDALGLLLTAMAWSTIRYPQGCTPIPEDARPGIVETLQEHLDPLCRPEWLEELQSTRNWAMTAAMFQHFSHDYTREEHAHAVLRAAGGGERWQDEGVELIERSALPWHERRQKLLTAFEEEPGRVDRVDEVLALAEEFPGILPLEWMAATWSFRAGKLEPALAHARLAYRAFPGHGQALLLAQILYRSGQWDELLSGVLNAQLGKNSNNIHARRLLAQAALQAAPADAPALWQAVVELDEATDDDRLQLAFALHHQNRGPEAAAIAWEVFERARASLSARKLLGCALVQLNLDERTGYHRTREIARELWERFQDQQDREAGGWYLELWLRLKKPGDLPHLDLDRLVQAGVLHAVDPDEFAPTLHARFKRQRTISEMYRRGWISVEGLASGLGLTPAELVEQGIKRQIPFTAPVALRFGRDDIAGRTVLVGAYELLLLDELELLWNLERELGPHGRIALFDDVYEQLRDAASVLDLRQRPFELEQLRSLRATLEGAGAVTQGEDDAAESETEEQWAERHGARLVREYRSEDQLSLGDVARALNARGRVARSLVERITDGWADNDSEPIELPECIALDDSSVALMAEVPIVDALLDTFPGAVLVTPDALRYLTAQIESLEARVNAHKRARHVWSWLAEQEQRQRVVHIPRPRIALPPAQDPVRERVRSWMILAASWRLALAEKDKLHLLTADFLAGDLFVRGIPEVLREIVPTWEVYTALVAPVRTQDIDQRVLSFARLARELAEPDRAQSVAERLLALGFTDVYDPNSLLDLIEEFGNGPVLSKTLERIEARAADTEKTGWQFARLGLPGLYAATIWTACCERDMPQALDVVHALLDRAAEIGREHFDDVLTALFHFLWALTVQHGEASFVRADGDMMLLTPDSPAGRLWQAVGSWSGITTYYELVQQEATDLLVELDESRPGSMVWAGPLYMGAEQLDQRCQGGRLLPAGSVSEALAVLSALWDEPPFAKVLFDVPNSNVDIKGLSVEDALVRAAQLFDEASEESLGEVGDTGLELHVPLDVGGATIKLFLPPAAVILRTAPETQSGLARVSQWAWGPDDSRLIEPLETLAAHPDDKDAQAAFARLSVTAPWRRFRIDARSLLRWGTSNLSSSFPSSIDELRMLLSEPPRFELVDDPQLAFADLLHARLESGIWQGRLDVPELMVQCVELPGQPHIFVRNRLTPDTAIPEFEMAMARLAECSHHPAARVAADVTLIALGVTVGEELRQHVAELVAETLAATAQPPADTLAAFEPALLRVARGIVGRLSRSEIPRVEQVWLTWRLYQWMIRQLEHVDPDTRLEHMRALAEAAPALPGFPTSSDLLDPVRYGRARLDIRLLCILHSLCMLQPRALRLLSSDALEKTLEELSTREPTAEEREIETFPEPAAFLGWGPAPRTVPALAARLLEQIRKNSDDAADADQDSDTDTV